MWNPFSSLKGGEKSVLGIDIGTSSVKVLQLGGSRDGSVELQTYGQLATYGHIHRFNNAIQTPNFRFFQSHVVKLVDTLLDRADASAKSVVFSVPVFSSFVTTLTMPVMDPADLKTAVPIEARQYIPSPIAEVALSWSIVGMEGGEQGGPDTGKQGPQRIRILLVAVPKEIVQQYMGVADEVGLDLQALELESLALMRSSTPNTAQTTVLLDMGARSTGVSIVDRGSVQLSHHINIAGEDLTHALERKNGKETSFVEAEQMKRDMEFAGNDGTVRDEVSLLADRLRQEIEKTVADYQKDTKRRPRAMVLAGGSSKLKGLDAFLGNAFPDMDVALANPWQDIDTPEALEPVLSDIGPSYAVVVGLALRGLRGRERDVRQNGNGSGAGMMQALKAKIKGLTGRSSAKNETVIREEDESQPVG